MAENTTETTPPATPPAVSSGGGAGTIATYIGLAAAVAVVVVGLVFTFISKLGSNDQVSNILYVIIGLTGVAGIAALVATILNVVRGASGRMATTVVSGVTLLATLAFVLVMLLPRVNNLLFLNNSVEPFGKGIQNYCQTPLQNETTRYTQFKADASSYTPPFGDPVALAKKLTADIATFQADLPTLQADLAKTQALSLPNGKYGDLRDGCAKDLQGTIAFISDTTAIPTAQFLQGVASQISTIPASVLPTAAQPILLAIVKSAVPASYSAIGMMQATIGWATGQTPIPFPANVPAAEQKQLTPAIYLVLGGGYAQFVAGAMDAAAKGADPALTNAGNCFADDIINTLHDNLAPMQVDTNAIVGQGLMPCTH